MGPRNLILQRSDAIEVYTKPKRGEGSLHPRPKGQGIRDPPHSRSNKLEQELGTVTSKTEGLGCCCAEKETENRTILPIIDKKRETKLETLISRTEGQSCCCEEKMVENRTFLPIREKKEKEGLGSVANRIEGTGYCCEEKVIENEVPVTIISEKKGEEGLETMTFQIEGLGCSLSLIHI